MPALDKEQLESTIVEELVRRGVPRDEAESWVSSNQPLVRELQDDMSTNSKSIGQVMRDIELDLEEEGIDVEPAPPGSLLQSATTSEGRGSAVGARSTSARSTPAQSTGGEAEVAPASSEGGDGEEFTPEQQAVIAELEGKNTESRKAILADAVAQGIIREGEEQRLLAEIETGDETVGFDASGLPDTIYNQEYTAQAELMAWTHGYPDVETMMDVVRGTVFAISPELEAIAANVPEGADGDEMLYNVMMTPEFQMNYGITDTVAQLFAAPIQQYGLKYRNSETGQMEDIAINAFDMQRVVGLGFDPVGAGAIFRGLAQTGVPHWQVGRDGAYIGFMVREQTDALPTYAKDRRQTTTGFQLESDKTVTRPGFENIFSPESSYDETPAGPADFAPGQGPSVDGSSFFDPGELFGGIVEANRPESGAGSGQPFGMWAAPWQQVQDAAAGAAKDWTVYLDRFNGHEELAFLAANGGNQGALLAEEIFRYGSPQSEASVHAITEIFGRYNWDDVKSLGLFTGPGGDRKATNFFMVGGENGMGGGGGGGTTVTANIPDPVSTAQTYEALYRQLLLRDPTDDELASFVADIESTIMGRTDVARQEVNAGFVPVNVWTGQGGQTMSEEAINQVLKKYLTDVQAEALGDIEASEAFARLYRHRPEGVDPLTYATQFKNKVARTIGQEEANLYLKPQELGMLSGDLRTATGAAAYSEEGMQSATLQEKWARAARVIKEVI